MCVCGRAGTGKATEKCWTVPTFTMEEFNDVFFFCSFFGQRFTSHRHDHHLASHGATSRVFDRDALDIRKGNNNHLPIWFSSSSNACFRCYTVGVCRGAWNHLIPIKFVSKFFTNLFDGYFRLRAHTHTLELSSCFRLFFFHFRDAFRTTCE